MKRMGFANTLYEAGTAEEVIPRWYAEGYRADALIVDHTDRFWLAAGDNCPLCAQKMVYVSCNVSALARDLVKLCRVYDVHYIQSVDMFRIPLSRGSEEIVQEK